MPRTSEHARLHPGRADLLVAHSLGDLDERHHGLNEGVVPVEGRSLLQPDFGLLPATIVGQVPQEGADLLLGEAEAALPGRLVIYPNYPNPFNPSTTFRFYVPDEGLVSLKIYNLLGREVANLVQGTLSEGIHEIQWKPGTLSSGLYIARLEMGGMVRSRTLIYQK